jgi:hypothetical protein
MAIGTRSKAALGVFMAWHWRRHPIFFPYSALILPIFCFSLAACFACHQDDKLALEGALQEQRQQFGGSATLELLEFLG